MLKKLVLFDIDGTLLKVSSINRRILMDALLEIYGTEGSAATHDFSGRMDSTIIYDVLDGTGLTRHAIEGKFDAAKQSYIRRFRKETKTSDITLLVGVRELLNDLASRSNILLGLLTGNFEASGRHKLQLPGIEHYFSFGAFADDGFHRNDLPSVAVERAYRITGKRFIGQDIVIVGDTVHDITCARVLDGRSIAVATGNFSMDELQKHKPSDLFENLSRTENVIHSILKP
ncbi:MAG: HAD hydrolase-like protein [Chlorobium sp.]|jgi:phosphoglycolate phosphatase|uniref:HAD hydrolase-like protein n=1 Tax=Chlorobium sp. TaxID=1095 RepID=UPI001DC851D1|nr:HAD hydrolase-like protein [Chlorobium sp.]MBN1279578.1 HAD hydrolase-like protein [Chlorobiaceae bacterium]MCF8216469.1 HAD hydrolase-like protein [Chlorobium sp.]MCF8271365.1 HAD hydrolase-like protein [Chlorobium sp.]MCF8287746.1 HAD hydrolase-like protein [Chlorobium sp.]MCF8291276.1 HAD hydrolase-like protein [Chlorobium sp.]